MKFGFKKALAVAAVAVTGFGLAGCSAFGNDSSSTSQANSAASTEANAQGQDSTNLINNQPVPVYKFSQARQIMIDAQNIEANGENTTTFGLSNNGALVWHCSSIGMPVPAAAQLTNPSQQVEQPDGGGYQENNGDNVVPQMDPFGLYTGDTTGTYTLCVDPHGNKYLQYWEGYTDSVSGPATYDNTTHQVVMQGTPIQITAGSNVSQTQQASPHSSPNSSASHG